VRRFGSTARRRRLTGVAATTCALLLGSAVTWALVVAAGRAERDSVSRTMDRRAQDVDRTITNEVREFHDTLDDLGRAVGSQTNLTAADYSVMTSGLDPVRLPGAGGVAFVVPATDDRVASVQRRWRAEGAPGLSLQPVGRNVEHMVVVFDRPLDGGPQISGRDLSQAAYSAAALRSARDSVQFVVSEPHVLVRDQGAPAKQQVSFTFTVPVYAHHGTRKGPFEGWIVVDVRGGDFLDRILEDASGYGLRARLDDGSGTEVATVPHHAQLPASSLNRTMSVTAGQQQWQVTVSPTKAALDTAGRRLVQLTLLCGIVVTLLMSALVGNLVFARNRALAQVDEATAALRKLAFHDPLTGLANRLVFYDRIRAASTGRFAVLFIDLDGFKQVNDALGHAIGDHLLREVADCLCECTRAGDTVTRLGGDEFAVLIEHLDDLEDARECADRIVRLVAAPILVDGVALQVGASVGIAVGEPGEDVDEVLRRADEAMYEAKSLGKGRFVLA
jgi:diguanylate cyclase (GGDEF)-like protein